MVYFIYSTSLICNFIRLLLQNIFYNQPHIGAKHNYYEKNPFSVYRFIYGIH